MFRGKKGRQLPDLNKVIAFKPFSVRLEESDEQPRSFEPVPDEEGFLSWCPIKFFPHQVQALRWMHAIEAEYDPKRSHVGGILGDVMGLGKTVDILGMISMDTYYEKGKPANSTIIIATLTLLDHWYEEAKHHLKLGDEEVMIYHGTERFSQLEQRMSAGKRPTIIITTYETAQKDLSMKEKSWIFKLTFQRAVLDEAHVARNPKTKTFKSLKHVHAKAVWCVTGTPIVNSHEDFRYLSIIANPDNPLTYSNAEREEAWKKKYLLRRTKDTLDIPPMVTHKIKLDMSEFESKIYRKLEKLAQQTFDNLVVRNLLSKNYQTMLLVVGRLRQLPDHFLLPRGHPFTSKLLEAFKTRFGIPLVPIIPEAESLKRKAPEAAAGVYDDNTDFLTSEAPKKKKKKSPKKVKSEDISAPPAVQGTKRKAEADATEQPDAKAVRSDSEGEPVSERVCSAEAKLEEEGYGGIPEDILLDQDAPPPPGCTGFQWFLNEVNKLDPKTPDVEDFPDSTKMTWLVKKLDDIRTAKPSAKSLVFSQFTTFLDLMECRLISLGYRVARFDGRQQNPAVRKFTIKDFKTNPNCTVMLISLKAGGVGLNLLPAENVFLMDNWWNSSVEKQAIDRIHRIGQTQIVNVYSVQMRGTIEKEVGKIQKKKRNSEDGFFDEEAPKFLSIGDIQTLFNTMKTRQQKLCKISAESKVL
jgi:SNF2 family DNA or RNA helicase